LTINYLWAGLVLRKKLIILATLGIVASYFLIAIYLNLQPQRNDVSISLIDPDVRSTSLTIAVIGDVHLSEGVGPLNKFRALLLDVKAADPDLIVFVGDYTANPSGIDNMPIHRVNIINTLKLVNPIPRAVVLGNYESWSDADEWRMKHAYLEQQKVLFVSVGLATTTLGGIVVLTTPRSVMACQGYR